MYSAETSTNETQTQTGRVKWFNNKVGYGFITLNDERINVEKDIFVHHSALHVQNDQYRYLVQGEYVNFQLVRSVEGPHEFYAGNVSGVNGGKLMCETRNDFSYREVSKDKPRSKKPYIERNDSRESDRRLSDRRGSDSRGSDRRLSDSRGSDSRSSEWKRVVSRRITTDER